MPVRLKDFRRIIDLDHAKSVLRDMTSLYIGIEAKKAATEKRIQALKEKVDEATKAEAEELTRLEALLTDFIGHHPGLFTKPRAVKTDFGSFGLRTVTELTVENEREVIDKIMENGYDDCIEIKRRLIKKSVQARITDGEDIPGCFINTGDVAFWKPNKSLVEEKLGEGDDS